jgi:hypothetical protein
MPEKHEPASQPTTTRVSSAYTRQVGNVRIDVVNVKQHTGAALPKKASKKWAVIARNGKKLSVIGATAHKYPAIDILLAHEKMLKAKEAAKTDKSDKSA